MQSKIAKRDLINNVLLTSVVVVSEDFNRASFYECFTLSTLISP